MGKNNSEKMIKVKDLVGSDDTLLTLDGIKEKLLNMAKSNDNTLDADQLLEAVDHFEFNGNEINDLYAYFAENGITINSSVEEDLEELEELIDEEKMKMHLIQMLFNIIITVKSKLPILSNNIFMILVNILFLLQERRRLN